MTVAALLRLLDQIDTEGGPEAARRNRLHLPDEGTPDMTSTPHPDQDVDVQAKSTTGVRRQEPELLPVGQLLKWGDSHHDSEIQDQAARARAALAGLRTRHAADQELKAITTEAQQLEQRLAQLRSREAELTPAKPKSKRTPVDYPAAEVRAWARANNIPCSGTGRVQKAVLDAWRAANPQAAGASS